MSLHTLSTETIERGGPPRDGTDTPVLRAPRLDDAAAIWRIAKDSRVLDTNSSYAYLLWCRDFADTTVVAEVNGSVVGFVIGYLRPQAPDTLFVWQVAVSHTARGRGIGTAMVEWLLDALPASTLETTVSPDNAASIAMFDAVARHRGARMTKHPLFDPAVFPDEHAAEDLYRIAPIAQK